MSMRIRYLYGVLLFLLLFTFVNAGNGAELISAGRNNVPKFGESLEPAISSTGRYVVFSSLARLLPEDKNSISDIYLKDRETGALRLVSDERGGDQPVISANGRFIAFRVLEEFPKIRLADLDSLEEPRTVSYPFGGGRSFHAGDSPVISADGRFVAFSYRPVSGFTNSTSPQLCVNDTFVEDRLSSNASITNDFSLNTLGRSSMALDGNVFFVETSDSLVPADTNDDQDIYMATRGSNFVTRLSATQSGLPEAGSVRDPVTTLAGDTVFFISERQLRASDTDGRATIYRSISADDFATPQPIPTPVRPIALSKQATSDGKYVVFLGQGKSGGPQPFILNVSTGKVTPLSSSAVSTKGAPVISADNGFVAFASSAPLTFQDWNGAPDVYAVRNPDRESRIEDPTVTLTNPADGFVGTEGSPITFTASVLSPDSPVVFTAIEVDGREVARVNGGFLNQGISISRGIHKIRAVALNAAGVAGKSDEIVVTVRGPVNQLTVHGITDLTRTLQPDGFTEFAGTVRVDNRFAANRGPLQLVLIERPIAMTWEIFGNEGLVPIDSERILQIIDQPSVPGNSLTPLEFSGLASPPKSIADGFQGLGFTVVARLREFVGNSWVTRDEITVLEIRPRLDEETPGPNGGIPVPGSDPGAPPFNPQLLQDIQIQGAAKVAGTASALYKAIAVFSSGSAPCTPVWQITSGGNAATISPAGILKAKNVSSPVTVSLKATFNGRTRTIPVTITPVVPRISVRAMESSVDENSGNGSFKILRSTGLNNDLTVNYEVSGTASSGFDYLALSGVATIPAGSSSVSIPVTSLDDGNPEGREKVTLTLLASEEYRLGSAQNATVIIEDDEATQPGQPDIVLSRSGKVVGELEFGFADNDKIEQQLSVRGSKNKTSTFSCQFVNRTNAAETYTVEGSGDSVGFKVRYFNGSTDVTAAVVSGTFTFNGVEPGAEARLTLKITPTNATPRGATLRCVVKASSTQGLNDVVEAAVKRAR